MGQTTSIIDSDCSVSVYCLFFLCLFLFFCVYICISTLLVSFLVMFVYCHKGTIPSGLKVHSDEKHLIYPVGCTIVIENIATKRQEFLAGHSNPVSCLALSRSGNFIASGQVTDMGFKVA